MSALVAQPVLIPVEVVNFSRSGEVSCGTCVSACCRKDVAMPLTPEEAQGMRDAGTELKLMHVSEKQKFSWLGRNSKTALYQLESDCGNLRADEPGDPGICTAMDNPARPEICRTFKAGNFSCHAMRKSAGVTSEEDFDLYLQKTAG